MRLQAFMTHWWARINLVPLLVVLTGVAPIALIWQVTLARADYEESEAVRHEFLNNANLAAAIEQHTSRILHNIDQTFNLVETEYRAHGSQADLAQSVARGAGSFKYFTYLAVIDSLGSVSAGPDGPVPVNASDRAYFKHHRAINDLMLLVSPPTVGRVSGKWSIHITRRLSAADGSFAGLIVGAVEPAFFANFYLQTDVGEQGTVTLVGLDGIVRARRLGKQVTVGQNVMSGGLLAMQRTQPQGSLLTGSVIDGVARYLSYKTLQDYPLVVAVGTAQHEVLAPVKARQKTYYLAASVATLTLLSMVCMLLWLLHRQKTLQMAARKSDALQRATFNMAAVGMAHVHLGGNCIEVNDKLCAILGKPRAEFLSQPVHMHVHPDDREAHQNFFDRLRTAPQQAASNTMEVRYLHQDGSVIWGLCSVALVLPPDDNPPYFIASVIDITERRQVALSLRERDRQLAASFDYSGIGMALMQLDGSWLKVNPALCNMIGYTEPELLSTPFQDIMLESDRAAALRNFGQLLTGGSEKFQTELRYRHRFGQVIWVSLTVSVVRNDDGQPAHLVAHVQDITQSKTAEQEIAQLNNDLEARVSERTRQLKVASKELTDFSHSMAHDLRQPLSSIMGFSELLQRDAAQQLGERGEHYLARIQSGVRTIGDSSDALLLLARLSTQPLLWEKVDLASMAKEMLARLALQNPQRKTKLVIDPHLTVMGDPTLLAVVMDNLISNAWKFSSRMDRVDIEIGKQTDGDGPPVYFVRDRGVGFDMAYIDKLFGNFQRLHSPNEFEGTGIGLASAQRIILRHGGRIWARSEPGEGATFYFTLGSAPLQPLTTIIDEA